MTSGDTRGPNLAPADVGAVIVRPWLWFDGLLVVLRLARRGWWHRWPPLPLADPVYLGWRNETQYGGRGEDRYEDGRRGRDLVSYLEYCRALRRA